MSMTVKELIAELSELPPNALVVMSRDAEGNGYSPLSTLDTCHYTAETTWRGEIDDDEDPHPDGINAVALWPVC